MMDVRGYGNVKGLNPKISGRVSRKINSRDPLAFVQVDNGAMHLNEAPLGRDRAPLSAAVLLLSLTALMSFSASLGFQTHSGQSLQ